MKTASEAGGWPMRKEAPAPQLDDTASGQERDSWSPTSQETDSGNHDQKKQEETSPPPARDSRAEKRDGEFFLKKPGKGRNGPRKPSCSAPRRSASPMEAPSDDHTEDPEPQDHTEDPEPQGQANPKRVRSAFDEAFEALVDKKVAQEVEKRLKGLTQAAAPADNISEQLAQSAITENWELSWQLLKKGADPSWTDVGGVSFLHRAAWRCKAGLAAAVVKMNPGLASQTTHASRAPGLWTPLMFFMEAPFPRTPGTTCFGQTERRQWEEDSTALIILLVEKMSDTALGQGNTMKNNVLHIGASKGNTFALELVCRAVLDREGGEQLLRRMQRHM